MCIIGSHSFCVQTMSLKTPSFFILLAPLNSQCKKKSDMRKMTLSKSMKKSRLRGQNFFLAQRFPFSPGGSRAARNFFQRGLQTSFPTQDFGRFEEIQCVPVCLCIRKSPPCQWLYQWLCPAYAIVLPPPHPNPSPPWSPVPCLNSRW